jgi:ubiquinone/menaquinone biosynthesis C-methylase UbiE
VSLVEYKRKQIEHEDFHRPRYNLEPVNWTPVEAYYIEREYAHALRLLRRQLPPEAIKTLLVCGVGAGADLHYWLTHLPLVEAVGLDFSIESIRASQRRIELNGLPDVFRFMRADFEHIPLADNAVDVGVFVHTLHHAFDPEQGFKELWRVSRRAVLLIEPFSTPITRLFARIGIAQDVEEVGNKVVRFTLDQYREWAGQECRAFEGESHFYYYHPVIYQQILPRFNSRLGTPLFKLLYQAANTLLLPMHSRLVAVLVKQP